MKCPMFLQIPVDDHLLFHVKKDSLMREKANLGLMTGAICGQLTGGPKCESKEIPLFQVKGTSKTL